ncbi:uncharacterized protein LOC114130822 isoform X2 [Aphis gossypii]|uniref:Uncharacterized protein n=1 Tax=Aphis gossypii TaxID=80765 RepID=A0A9P0NH28_APHGO|nr:uncharacterized protein LOC114130822 isoform X2 [Aphis gossypii]CAH1723073.1 unnamed protein product [Aphis gossypii]
MLLNQRLRLSGGLLALGVVALFAAHPSPIRGGSSHNLESHQYKDSRKCLLQLTARTLGCGGGGGGVKRTVVTTKRRPDKRQHGGGATDNDLDQNNNNFDYNYDDDDGGGGGDGGDGAETRQTFYEPPLITDPRDRMLPVIYSPRPMYAPPRHPQQQSHQQQPPYNRYDEQGVGPINQFEMPIIIECPPTEDGFERFACPSPDKEGRFRCIDDHVLCDGYIDCPNGDDEDRKNCFFFKTTKAHLDILADALLRWARGR